MTDSPVSAYDREVQFQAGYDHRDQREGGCHGLQIRFVLRGSEGAVQFLIYTDWLPSWVCDGSFGKTFKHPPSPTYDLFPMAADLGYHWPTPRYEGQEERDCDLLPSGKCFYDGSGLNAELVMAELLTGGGEAVWKHLADYYESLSASEGSTP